MYILIFKLYLCSIKVWSLSLSLPWKKSIPRTTGRRTDKQADQQTDRQTDEHGVRQQKVFFRKKKKTLKINVDAV